MKNKKKIVCVLLGMQLLGACAAVDQSPYGNSMTGTAGGAAVGALLGQVIGQDTKGTLIGAGIGALAD